MSNTRDHFIGLALAVTLGACASTSQPNVDLAQTAAVPTTVTVQNNYSEDMAIYVVNSRGGRWRIGTIMSASTGKLLIPEHALVEPNVQLLAQTIGPGLALTFPRTMLRPGDRVELVLEHTLVLSSFWVK